MYDFNNYFIVGMWFAMVCGLQLRWLGCSDAYNKQRRWNYV